MNTRLSDSECNVNVQDGAPTSGIRKFSKYEMALRAPIIENFSEYEMAPKLAPVRNVQKV